MKSTLTQNLVIAILAVIAGALLCLVAYTVAPQAFSFLVPSASKSPPPTRANTASPQYLQPPPTLALPQPPSLPNAVSPGNPPKPASVAGACPPCTLVVDTWRLEIEQVHSDAGTDPSRQIVSLMGSICNEGHANDTFMPFLYIMIQDSQGRTYQADVYPSSAAATRYGASDYTFTGANPGACSTIAFAYDTPSTEKSWLIVPDKTVSSWGGNFSFSVP